MAKFDRAIQRMKRRTVGKTDSRQIRTWEALTAKRAAKDPELARLESFARLIVLDLVDVPYASIQGIEEAQAIVEKAEEVLGPEPSRPDAYDPAEYARFLGLL